MRSFNGCLPIPVIDLRGFFRARLIIGGGVLLALGAIAQGQLSLWLQVLSAALVLAYGGLEFRRFGPWSRASISRLQVTRDGRFLCGLGQDPGPLIAGTVQQWWTLCGWMTGLVVCREDGRRGHAILFRDQLPPDQWRQLCTHLRLARASPGPQAKRFT